MNRFFSHSKQPYTSIFMCWGFLFGCIVTVFFYKTWQFYSCIVFLTILSRYFKRFLPVLLGFIVSIFNVIGHHSLFYTFNTENMTFNEEVFIVGKIQRVLGGQPTNYVQVRLSQVGDMHYGPLVKPLANLAIKNTGFDIQSGLKLTGNAKLRLFRGRKNFSGFDSELYAFKNKIIFKGRINSYQLLGPQDESAYHEYRHFIWRTFGSLELNWFYYTLLTGDKSKIEDNDREVMRTLGLSHLMAISGLHIGIVFAISFWISKFACWVVLSITRNDQVQRYHLRMFYALAGLVIAFMYVYLSGMSVSAIRAYSMILLATLVYFLKRNISKPRLLLIAASLTLLLDPFVLLNVGWYFSFIAVAAIFISVVHYQTDFVTPMSWLFQLFKVQFYIGILLAPLSIFIFQGVSLAGLLTNLVAIPLLTFVIFPFILFGIALSYLVNITSALALFDGLFNWLLQSAIEVLGSNGWWNSGKIELITLLFIYSVFIFLLFDPIRKLVWWPIVLYGVYRLTVIQPRWEIDVFDVGHGTSVLVSSQGKGLLYDLGAKYFNKYAIFEHVVQPHIVANDIELAYTILSHQDKDHIGGVEELYRFDRFESLAEFHKGNTHSHCELKSLQLNTVFVETLWPIFDLGSKNNNSCVVKISDGKFSLLLPGDIERKAEFKLIEQYPLGRLNSTILLAPHHGSKTSSSDEFIRAVNPEIAIYSRSYHSQWKLPHSEVVDRYRESDVVQLDTAINGHINIKVFDDELVLSKARTAKEFWFLR
ncbi:DNA internalization-related competence protein ComEC/Rec2 [Pseudoalteromonas citrea]|uniref:DNA internalization-related competence protein ComEC/Rec2 n=2 Tax=Pseudoalteromonas citrea TaxID=43655 RepID=A0A5S3XMH2_9GAMM|nr:DNA internalization-related competence protein ComEC/Rec2 [Pseudoalteromonas citrea]